MAILKALPRTKYSVRKNKYLPVMRYIPSLSSLCFMRHIHSGYINFIILPKGNYHAEVIRHLDIELQRLIEGKVL